MKATSLSAQLSAHTKTIEANNAALIRAPHSVQVGRINETHCIATLEIRGRIYGCTYAARVGQEPTAEEVLQDWRETPKDFRFYNQMTGSF